MSRIGRALGSIKTAGLASYGLFFTGICLIMLSTFMSENWGWPHSVAAFFRDVGLLLSAVMAGTLLHEKLLRDEMVDQFVRKLDERLEARMPELDDVPDKTAVEVHRLFCDRPPGMTGIRLLAEVRRGFGRYYDWVNEHKPQDLFFAGRSVLNRIDIDIVGTTKGRAEEILFRRLREGCRIKILFLDPRIDILDRLAREEGQAAHAMLIDIARSIGISRRLFELLDRDHLMLTHTGSLSIRVYDRVPYFGYHKQDKNVIIGFYFHSSTGSSSPAYELVDDRTKEAFGGHFLQILADAVSSTLVEFDGSRSDRPIFNSSLYKDLRGHLAKPENLGPEKTEDILNRR